MTSWWCAGGEPYTACGLFEGHVDDNAPASPSKTTHIELEFVELPKRDGEVEMQDMGQSWMQPPVATPLRDSNGRCRRTIEGESVNILE